MLLFSVCIELEAPVKLSSHCMKEQWKFGAYILLGGASYGILSTIAKRSYQEGFSLTDVVHGQFLFGVMGLTLLISFRKQWKPFLNLSTSKILLATLSGLPLGLTSLAYYASVQYIPASLAILLLFQYLWMGIVIDAIWTKKLPLRKDLVSTVFLLLATTLAAGGDLDIFLQSYPLKGLLYGLFAALSYASFIAVSKIEIAKSTPLNTSFLRVIGGLLLCLLVLPVTELSHSFFTLGFIKFSLPLGIFGMLVPIVLFAVGTPKIGVAMTAILSSIELPIAVSCGVLFLNEEVSSLQWLGVALILSVVFLSNRLKA